MSNKKTEIFSIILFLSSTAFQLSIFVVAVILIIFFSYLIGYDYLSGSSLPGNDAFSFYTIVDWLGKFYPKVPFWFPLQGGGVSFTGYQWFAAYIINFISHLTALNNVQAFKLLGFSAIPITGIGIFVYCWTRLTEIRYKLFRQIIGIIAALFFVTAPASWVWLVRWGFYAEQVSIMFVPWILIFIDLYLEKLFDGKRDFYYRVSIFGAVLFGILGFNTHFYIVITTLILFSSLFVIRFITTKENKLSLIRRLFIPLLIFLAVFSCAFSSRYYAYNRYNSAVVSGGLRGGSNVASNRQGTADSLLTPRMMLSLADVTSEKLLMARDLIVDMRFPFYVWLLLVPGLVFGLFKEKRIFAFSILALIGFFANTNVDVYIFLSNFPVIKYIPIINQIPIGFLGRLFFVTGRVIIPVAAAYGGFIVWEFLLGFLKGRKLLESVRAALVLVLGTSTICLLIFMFYNLPYSSDTLNVGALKIKIYDIWRSAVRPQAVFSTELTPEEQKLVNQNPENSKIADLVHLKYVCAFDGPGKQTSKIYQPDSICYYYPNPQATLTSAPLDVLRKFQKICNQLTLREQTGEREYCRAFYRPTVWDQLGLKSWPGFKISSDISDELNGTRDFFKGLPESGSYRYDISGFSARTIMSTPLVNKNSEIQLYINNLSLLYNLSNYQTQTMYSEASSNKVPGVLTELAKWFGLNYIYLSGTPLEPLDFWKTDPNWTKITGKEEDGWRKFNLKTDIVSWDSRPKVLVISDNSKNFFDAAFRFFTKGALKYEQAIPVQGDKNIDDYSGQELSKYDAIFMMAYGYKNRSKAYSLLNNYVKNGGKLIFDTGWQYYVPDYQLEKAPDFMPFESLSWKNLDRDAKFSVDDTSIAGNIDATKMGDLTYGSSSWGISAPGSLRDWAKTVVSANGTPLIVTGNYGKGKVTWIGFNIVPHSESKQSQEEVKLFNDLITGFVGDGVLNQNYPLQEVRSYPDDVELKLDQDVNQSSTIYFREAYYPDWHAYLVSGGHTTGLKISRGGSGFMVMTLPQVKSGDSVILRIVPSFGQRVSDTATVLSFIVLIIYLFIPKVFSKIPLPDLKIKAPKFKNSLFSNSDEDENY